MAAAAYTEMRGYVPDWNGAGAASPVSFCGRRDAGSTTGSDA